MKVFAVIGTNWNIEYGYDEYSKPIEIRANKKEAESLANALKSDERNTTYDDYIVEPYEIK